MIKRPYLTPEAEPLELITYTVFCTSDDDDTLIVGEDMDPWNGD